MYNMLFDEKKQNQMRAFFLKMSKYGIKRKYKKNEIIDIPGVDFIGIVVEGKIKQSLISPRGIEKTLYILIGGEIFGEMDYFSEGKCNTIIKVMDNSIISIIERNVLEKRLKKQPELYRYFIHSLIRKFRIVMMQMADMAFNDALGKIANILLRLASQEKICRNDKIIINIELTHQDLANLIGCSRITVTKGLKELKDKKIIDIKNKKIIINDIKKLQSYVEPIFIP